MQGCDKFTGPRTVPVRSGPGGLGYFWFFEHPGLFLRAANGDGSRSDHELHTALAVMWLCGAIGGIDLRAATGTSTSQFSFDVWQVGGDLEQNPVTAVVQSREGYLWLGTYTGFRSEEHTSE